MISWNIVPRLESANGRTGYELKSLARVALRLVDWNVYFFFFAVLLFLSFGEWRESLQTERGYEGCTIFWIRCSWKTGKLGFLFLNAEKYAKYKMKE